MRRTMKTMLFALAVLAVAAIHFVTSFFVAFAAGISGEGEYRLLHVAAAILTFPLSLIPAQFELPEPLNWAPWMLLSLCWGLAGCLLIRALIGAGRSTHAA